MGQGGGIGKLHRRHAAQFLLTKALVELPAQHLAQLSVIAQFRVGVQWQVVGVKIDVMRQQQAQALAHPAHHAAILATPKQAMVNQQGVSPSGNRGLNQRSAGRDAADDARHVRLALHLQAVGAVVFEAFGLQQRVQAVQQFSTRDAHGPALSASLADNAAFATLLPPTFMKRFWLLFSQTVTVLVAAYFVVATLQPDWLRRGARVSPAGITLLEAPSQPTGTVAPGSFSVAARKAAPAVVSINTSKEVRHPRSNDPWFQFFFGDVGPQAQTGLGSGVIVSPDGYILTNNHVVEGADEIEVTLTDSRRARARIIGTDPETDLAILKIQLDKLPVIVWGNSDQLAVGDHVLAIGNPFGVGQTVTSGIISALGRSQLGINTFENFIQTDAAINPGNSGGALIDVEGNLQGINTAIYSRSGGSMGIGFAIPVSTARQVLDGIVKDGQVRRGWIGVEPNELSPELAETFGVQASEGVILTGVLQAGPAAEAGIRPGDVIVQVAGQPVRNVSELLSAVAALQPGEPATFALQRGNHAMEVQVVPGLRPSAQRRARR